MTIHRVCFVSPLSRPILEPDFPCDFGGAEVRAVNFAKGLTKFSEFQVSMVLRAYRHEKPHAIGGLQAFFEKADAPIARTKDIPPGLAFLPKLAQAKLQKTWRSLRKRIGISRPVHVYQQHLIASLPTDLVCCFGVNAYTYNILTAAKDSGKRTLLMVAHDQDFDVQTHSDIVKNYGGDVQVYRRTVQLADQIVCQTPAQRDLLRQHFDRDGIVIRNPIELNSPSQSKIENGEYILWVGRADTFFKRADIMLKLARQCPSVPFVAIMNRRKPQVFDSLVSQAPPNVRIVERVPYHRIDNYYANAAALLSTSEGEGFPNAFLQAGKFGSPILSLNVDPGGMISQHGCGIVTYGDQDRLCQEVQRIWQARAESYRHQFSNRIQQYVQTYHALPDRVEELGQTINSAFSSEYQRAA